MKKIRWEIVDYKKGIERRRKEKQNERDLIEAAEQKLNKFGNIKFTVYFARSCLMKENSIKGNSRPHSSAPKALTVSQVSRIVNGKVKEGEVIKAYLEGNSRINYMPYEKKVIEYQDRHYVKKVPVKKKVLEYRQQTYIENIPRQVIKKGFYPVLTVTKPPVMKSPQVNTTSESTSAVQFLSIEKQFKENEQTKQQHEHVIKSQSQQYLQTHPMKTPRTQQEYHLPPKKVIKQSQNHLRNVKSVSPSPHKHYSQRIVFQLPSTASNSCSNFYQSPE